MDLSIEIILGYFATGTLWGVTNALMEVGSKDDSTDAPPGKGSKSKEKEAGGNVVVEGMKMFANLRFLLPFILNQLASVLNNFLVAKSSWMAGLVKSLQLILCCPQSWLRQSWEQ